MNYPVIDAFLPAPWGGGKCEEELSASEAPTVRWGAGGRAPGAFHSYKRSHGVNVLYLWDVCCRNILTNARKAAF